MCRAVQVAAGVLSEDTLGGAQVVLADFGAARLAARMDAGPPLDVRSGSVAVDANPMYRPPEVRHVASTGQGVRLETALLQSGVP